MITSPMCFSVLRVPRCRFYSLVSTWYEVFDISNPTCKKGYNHFRNLSSSIGRCEKICRSWSQRLITTSWEGRNKNSLSSAANVRLSISNEVIANTSTELTVDKTDCSSSEQIQHGDVRQLITKNKDLASLATFIVFDLDEGSRGERMTTGMSRTKERVIEIALQDLHGGENSTFHTLVNPGRDVENFYVHGISTSMVRRPGVPRMDELIPVLLQFVQSRQKPGGYVVFVAHNAKAFDVPFLVNEFKRHSFEIPSNWFFVDTLPLARDVIKAAGIVRGKASLQGIREYYGIQLKGSAHRAMSDVHSLSQVLQRMTIDLKLPKADLVQKAFKADELTSSCAKKKKDSN